MFLVACKGTETPQEQPSLKVNPLALEFAASGNASQTLTVEAVAVEWTHEVSGAAKEWLTVSKTDAETLTVTVSDNETAEKRSGTVTVSATDHPEMKPIGVTVSQEAGEVTEYSISVNPVSLEFEADSTEPQEVTVTAVGEGLTWTAAAEQGASWLHVEASGDKISVTVDAYEDTELQRAANIIVTPDREGVAAKSVRVTQQPAEEVPSLTVSPTDAMEFAYNETASRMLRVTAVACTWVAEAKDAEGNPAEWIELSVSRLPEELSGNVVVRVQPNSSLEARSGEVVIRTNTEGIEPITIAVTQGPGKEEFLSSLTDHVTLEDMNPAGGFYYYLSPAQKWDTSTQASSWQCELWGAGLTRTLDGGTYVYSGTGDVLKLAFYTSRINYNDDELFYIPDGVYDVQWYDYFPSKEQWVPFTVVQGREANNLTIRISHSWYVHIEDGEITESAPIWEGTMNVALGADDTYTIEMNFKDDAGWDITGTVVSKVTESNVNFWENPAPEPEEPEEPEDPDPGFGQ